MGNPWERIKLSDYENHMSLDSVMQLQAMNTMMKGQFEAHHVKTAMVLGVAGGNGLEYVNADTYSKVYGVDINKEYLEAVKKRYSNLTKVLTCLHVDLLTETEKLPQAELLIANLLIEYIGYDAFQQVINQVKPTYVSCIVQINTAKDNWVSKSPYIHAFDELESVHNQMEEKTLKNKMEEINYTQMERKEHILPNEKKLIQLDFYSINHNV